MPISASVSVSVSVSVSDPALSKRMCRAIWEMLVKGVDADDGQSTDTSMDGQLYGVRQLPVCMRQWQMVEMIEIIEGRTEDDGKDEV